MEGAWEVNFTVYIWVWLVCYSMGAILGVSHRSSVLLAMIGCGVHELIRFKPWLGAVAIIA
jgi:hypothetical protein